MVTRNEIIEEARKWLGTKHVHQGRVLKVGVDCIGLLVMPAKAVGVEIEDQTNYSEHPNPRNLLRALEAQLDPIQDGSQGPGDVAVFWFERGDIPQHVGLLTDVGLLHTFSNVGKVSEHHLNDWWRERIHSFWRYRGVIP